MASESYEKLTVEDFGARLIKSGDLDPVYIGLHNWETDGETKARWLVSYWCFYHCGVAGYMSQLSNREFWTVLEIAAKNSEPSPLRDRWPRASERRHFRGDNALKAVNHLKARYGTAKDMVDTIASAAPSFKAVNNAVQSHVGFGPWIGFKVADMLDRCLGHPVDFETKDVFMFKDPLKAALMVWRNKQGLPETAKPKSILVAVDAVVDHLREVFDNYVAPPLHDRPIGIQEIETVLCKWKSHLNGHYPIYNDIMEINENCNGWGANAQGFLTAMNLGCDTCG